MKRGLDPFIAFNYYILFFLRVEGYLLGYSQPYMYIVRSLGHLDHPSSQS